MEECLRTGCNGAARYRVSTGRYCVECTWIWNRRTKSKKRGKSVPTWEELKALMRSHCPHCGVEMTYERANKRTDVASIQHYEDGTVGVICHGCNSGAGGSKQGDSYLYQKSIVSMGYSST